MSQAPQSHSSGGESHGSYWSEKLAGRPPALELPTARARPPEATSARTRLPFHLPSELVRTLRTVAQEAGLTPFDALIAAFGAFLYRTTRQGDLLLGLREGERFSALRLGLTGRTTFRELLGTVQHELAECRAHALPLKELLKVAHSTRPDNLFQVLVTSDKLNAKDSQG